MRDPLHCIAGKQTFPPPPLSGSYKNTHLVKQHLSFITDSDRKYLLLQCLIKYSSFCSSDLSTIIKVVVKFDLQVDLLDLDPVDLPGVGALTEKVYVALTVL